MSAFEDVVLGRKVNDSVPDTGPPYITEGLVHEVVTDGLTFTVPDFDDGTYLFGPAPFPQALTFTPAAGDRCLVVFAGAGIDKPWVVGVWPNA